MSFNCLTSNLFIILRHLPTHIYNIIIYFVIVFSVLSGHKHVRQFKILVGTNGAISNIERLIRPFRALGNDSYVKLTEKNIFKTITPLVLAFMHTMVRYLPCPFEVPPEKLLLLRDAVVPEGGGEVRRVQLIYNPK